jgi:hypothetical protein
MSPMSCRISAISMRAWTSKSGLWALSATASERCADESAFARRAASSSN